MQLAPLTIPFDKLEADGDFDPQNPAPAETRLSATIDINGLPCHFEAIQVKSEDESMQAVNPDLQDWLEHLAEINNDTCRALEYNGRWYVILVHPFSV